MSDTATDGWCSLNDDALTRNSNTQSGITQARAPQADVPSTSFADQLRALDDERKALEKRHCDIIEAEKRRHEPLLDEINAIHEELRAAQALCRHLDEKEHELKAELDKKMAKLDNTNGATEHAQPLHYNRVHFRIK